MTAVNCILFFGKLYLAIVHDFLEKFSKIRPQRNRSVVYKKLRILYFEDGNDFSDFKFVRENAFSRDRLMISTKGAEIR